MFFSCTVFGNMIETKIKLIQTKRRSSLLRRCLDKLSASFPFYAFMCIGIYQVYSVPQDVFHIPVVENHKKRLTHLA